MLKLQLALHLLPPLPRQLVHDLVHGEVALLVQLPPLLAVLPHDLLVHQQHGLQPVHLRLHAVQQVDEVVGHAGRRAPNALVLGVVVAGAPVRARDVAAGRRQPLADLAGAAAEGGKLALHGLQVGVPHLAQAVVQGQVEAVHAEVGGDGGVVALGEVAARVALNVARPPLLILALAVAVLEAQRRNPALHLRKVGVQALGRVADQAHRRLAVRAAPPQQARLPHHVVQAARQGLDPLPERVRALEQEPQPRPLDARGVGHVAQLAAKRGGHVDREPQPLQAPHLGQGRRVVHEPVVHVAARAHQGADHTAGPWQRGAHVRPQRACVVQGALQGRQVPLRPREASM